MTEQDERPPGTVLAELVVYAEGQVTPGPGQTEDDLPTTEESD